MRKVKSKEIMLPSKIWKLAQRTLEEISDECGEEDLGCGYLLKYEGWSSMCVEKVWSKTEVEQKKNGIDTDSEEAKGEIEEICRKYAEQQSYKIIHEEWELQLLERGYRFISGGYDSGGLYGRTWTLFKKR